MGISPGASGPSGYVSDPAGYSRLYSSHHVAPPGSGTPVYVTSPTAGEFLGTGFTLRWKVLYWLLSMTSGGVAADVTLYEDSNGDGSNPPAAPNFAHRIGGILLAPNSSFTISSTSPYVLMPGGTRADGGPAWNVAILQNNAVDLLYIVQVQAIAEVD